MIYQSDAITLSRHEGGILELQFDLQGESVNKFNRATVESLTEALDAIEAEQDVRGLLVTSGKGVFIVGADITEFTQLFGATAEEIKGFSGHNNGNFNRLQQPAVPHRRRDQRLCHGRRPGNLPRLRPARHEHGGEDRPAGNQARHPAGLGRHRTPAAHHRRRRGGDVDRHGKDQSAEAALKAGAVDAIAAPEQLGDVAAARCSRRSTASWTSRAAAAPRALPCP
jgi:3-hydroxyacyl-CoA dehydrogenase/enoyl-CoA hydratase/3-hydroxybutyryl-CoA epimerase/enoyl-CoA isomerase